MKKRLLVIISMAVVMLVGATIAASADDAELIIWDGTTKHDVLVDNEGSFGAGKGSYSYDPGTETLTLTNVNLEFTITEVDDYRCRCITLGNVANLKINLVGNNTIIVNRTDDWGSRFLEAYGDVNSLTYCGNGSLRVDACFTQDLGNYVEHATIYVVDTTLEFHYGVAGAFDAENVEFRGACNVATYGENFGISAYNELRFNLSKGGKVYCYDTFVPMAAGYAGKGGIKLGKNNVITTPKSAKIIPEELCGYDNTIADADGNPAIEVVVEYVEGSAEGSTTVNTADHAPMIIFAVMAMLVILGTTTVLLKKQR